MKRYYAAKMLGLMFLMLFATQACDRAGDLPANPIDETKDRGHDLPNKVELIFTDLKNKAIQKATAEITKDTPGFQFADLITLKKGSQYHFEIVYYKNNQRMNNEFISGKMAQIHQHFFTLHGIPPEQMNEMLTYEYQDTDPEDGILNHNGTKLRLRGWDTKNPEAVDPIGLKGVLTVKESSVSQKDFTFRIRLAHFLVSNKLEQQTGEPRKYNELTYSGAFTIDTDLRLPVKLIK